MKFFRVLAVIALVGALLVVPGAIGNQRPAAAAGSTFTFDWSGTPSAPQTWVPGAVNDWDLVVHNRNSQDSMETVPAMHGADCSPPPARHAVNTFAGSVFICKNHLMTALNGGGYSEIVMTPARLLDFSGGGTYAVDASTLKDDDRDWIDFWISPFSENILLPSAGIPPDLNGPPRDAILIQEDASIPSTWRVIVFRNYAQTELTGTGLSTESCMGGPGGVSAVNRTTRSLSISRNHVRVVVGNLNCVVLDTAIPDPGFGVGVVEMAHHSYSPDEGSACNYTGCSKPVPNTASGNTWHWSHVTMSPAIPFTMLRGDMSLTGLRAGASTVHFAQAAPAGSFLRFGALAQRGSISVSANGGPFVPAVEAPQCGDFPTVAGLCPGVADGVYISYFTPVPAGTTSVTFSAGNSPHANQPWAIQDVSIWNTTATGVVNPPVGNPTPPVSNPTPPVSNPTPPVNNPPPPVTGVPPPVNTGPAEIGEDPAPIDGGEFEGPASMDETESMVQVPERPAIDEGEAEGETADFGITLGAVFNSARANRFGRFTIRSF